MKFISLTLYDFFAYLIPGATFAAGAFLIYWRLLPVYDDWNQMSPIGWITLLAIFYILGHSIQAVANATLTKTWHPELEVLKKMSEDLDEDIKTLRRRILGVKCTHTVNSGEAKVICRIADHAVLQYGKTDARDVYVYREGYYRAMSLSLPVLALGCLLRASPPPSEPICLFGLEIVFDSPFLLMLGAFSLVATLLHWGRYKRFAKYRIRYALYSCFLMISGKFKNT